MRRWLMVGTAAVAVAALVQPPALAEQPTTSDGIDRAVARAVRASREVPHTGQLTIVSFGERGPWITEIDLTRGEHGLRVERDGGWEFGRVKGEGFLRSSDTLLRVGGMEHLPAQLDRLRTKYDVKPGEVAELDTGPAMELALTERSSGTRREVLYVDEGTGLIVRRETFGTDGRPVRVVAYTDLDVGPRQVALPATDGLAVQEHRLAPAEVERLRVHGFQIPPELPRGYHLLATLEVTDASVPTLHCIYGDGLYTLSVFHQRGRMATTAVRGASKLVTADGGAVWRWPGSEPRRLVWTGDGVTYTVLTDAPPDELMDVVVGLPADPTPSILARLARGMARVGRWLWPRNRSDL